MIFQTLDDKKQCVAIYSEGELRQDGDVDGLTKTWGYAAYLGNYDIEYASLYCLGDDLGKVCPEHLREDWHNINQKLKAFFTAFRTARVDLSEICFYDLVQERFLTEFCDIKNSITEHVLQTYERPPNYDFLCDLTKVLHEIRYQEININVRNLDDILAQGKTRRFLKKLKDIHPYVCYDIAGTKTGRLTTIKNSFPILTLDKDLRAAIEPHNDFFLELDFNAAELRTLLALAGVEQPDGDIHQWNATNVYRGLLNREEAKKRIFAWLYNPASKDYLSNRTYNRDEVLEKYWDGTKVKTCFDREIEADAHHALNYIIQSTTSDLFLRSMMRVFELLKGKRSFISFCIHDSLVLDFAHEEKDLLAKIVKVFSSTDLGNFKTNVSMGKNFKKMQLLDI